MAIPLTVGSGGMGEGDAVLRVCLGPDGGSTAVVEAARDEADSVPVVPVGSTGATELEPLVLATVGGTTAFHANCSPRIVEPLVAALEGGTVPTDDAHAVVEHDPESGTLPRPECRPFEVGVRRVLVRCGWVRPAAVDDYQELLIENRPETADARFDRIRDVGLLGRGRGDGSTDAPIADQWRATRGVDGDPVVVVNANEADPAARTDGTLLGGVTVEILDAALAVAGVVGASDVIVYANESETLVARRVRDAVAELERHERTADAIDDVTLQLVTGPDEYKAGEMTMALESMEGNDRLEARLRPPAPSVHGLYGRPTVIHTPRTLAQVRGALLHPEWYDPDDADPGTRLVTVAGDVDAPATVELPTGTSLSRVRDAVTMPGRFKLASVGGRFGGLTRSLDLPPSAKALSAAGLGTNGVLELFDDERCVVALAGRRSRFAETENCGRCVPCREGSKQLTTLLQNVYDGDYSGERIRELGRVMRDSSICDFGRTAPRTVLTALDEFEGEFRAHADGRCPSGACGGLRS